MRPLALLAILSLAACGDDGAAGDAGPIDARADANVPIDGPVDAVPPIDAMPPPNTGSLLFDGDGDRVVVPATTGLGGYPAMTVELWVRPAAVGAAVLVTYADGADTGYRVGARADGGAEVRFAACSAFGGATALEAGAWTHIAGTWSTAPTGRPRLFLNGTQVTVSACAAEVSSVLADLVIGTGPGGSFSGHIDELRIWNLERTGPDLAATMNRRLLGDEPGLIGYWPFDDGSGDSADDATLNNNTARLGSAAGPDADDPTWSTETPF
jgi:hypothetical protein